MVEIEIGPLRATVDMAHWTSDDSGLANDLNARDWRAGPEFPSQDRAIAEDVIRLLGGRIVSDTSVAESEPGVIY